MSVSAHSEYAGAVRAHAAHHVRLAEGEGPRLDGSGNADGGAAQCAALASWQLELENFNAALHTALQQQEPLWLRPLLPIWAAIWR